MTMLPTFRTGSNAREGFTAIELMVVISVIAVLSTAAVGGISAALRQINVDRSAQAIEEAGRLARDLARRPHVGLANVEAKRYGVVVVDATAGAPAWVAVTYGATATDSTVLMDGAGNPLFRRELARGAAFFSGSDATAMSRLDVSQPNGFGWMFQYDTGLTTLRPQRHLVPTYVGIDPAQITAGGIDPTQAEMGPAYLALGDQHGGLRMGISCQASGVTATVPWTKP
jgi:prepilin-type N-terminal cleavage/methylation domain-containing protein